MGNLRKWLEDAERLYDEPIEAMCVGQHDNGKWDRKPKADENVLLSREDGLKKIDEDYDNGYGGADCYPLYAWTKSRIFFVAEYDGATGISYVPRHPIALEPQFSGQSPSLDQIKRMVAAKAG